MKIKTAVLTFILFAPAALMAQEPADLSLFGLIKQGGWAMYPLGLCSLAMFYLAIYCFLETRHQKFVPEAALPQVASQLRSHELEAAVNTLAAHPSVLSRSLAAALPKFRPDRPQLNKEQVEAVLVEKLEEEENGIGAWINYLNVIAAVAPMVGLLGTVSGMIKAFQKISEGGMGRPELLAGDIGEALITTATGLVIGIPAMILYFIVRNRLNHEMIQATQAASGLIDEVDGGDVSQ